MFLRNLIYGRAPVVKSGPSLDLTGRKVLIVDDDCTTGDSLTAAINLMKPHAAEIRTAVLRLLGEAHPYPTYYAENRVGAVLRHPRFPWIRYSPYYRAYWRMMAVRGQPSPPFSF
jgi:hypoxanthine phosphoribosyltransferase